MDEIDIDRAIERETANIQKQVAFIVSQAPQGTASESATHCIICDDPIPENRRKAVPGTKKCVGCQALAEQ